MASKAFDEFCIAQQHVNEFLWSSELGSAILQNDLKALKADIRVAITFGSLTPTPHAFVPNNKSGQPKYNPKVGQFDRDLNKGLESLCRYVIIRFHSALELFIWLRIRPFVLAGETPQKERDAKATWQKLDYRKLGEKLAAVTRLREPVPADLAGYAQAYRMLRNSIVHLQEHTFFDERWKDDGLRAKIETTFHGPERKAIMSYVCGSVGRHRNLKSTPPLFFYAIFMLTTYRNFANALEAALPDAP